MKKIILFEDINDNYKRQNKIVEKAQLDQDPTVVFLNVYSESSSIIKDKEVLVYIMGTQDLLDHLKIQDYQVVGYGPGFDDLKSDKKAREKLLADITIGSPDNIFDGYLASGIMTIEQVKKVKPDPKSETISKLISKDIPREPHDFKLENHVDDALNALSYIKTNEIEIAVPELNTFIGKNSKQDCMTYDELIGLLLVFKRMGAKKLYWKDKQVLNED